MEAKVNGVACSMFDNSGRLIVTPNALSTKDQLNIPADFIPGETLQSFLQRHVEGITPTTWRVVIDSREISQHEWDTTFLEEGQLVACRPVLGRSLLSLVAVAALTYVTFGLGSLVSGGGFIAANYGVYAAFGVYMAGSMLINKVLGPKIPKAGTFEQGEQSFSLSDQRNTPRKYAPFPIVWGKIRTAPDLASNAYTSQQGEDQYLNMILLAGLNVQTLDNLSIGNTALSSYEEVTLYYDRIPGHAQQEIPLYTNADTIAGGELTNGGPGTVRTTSVDTLAYQVDLEGQLYDIDNKGGTQVNDVMVTVESRPTGTEAWNKDFEEVISNNKSNLVRKTYSKDVPKGQYDIRVTMGIPRYNEGEGKDACKFSFTVLRSLQIDTADYTRFGRLGLRIKSSAQLTGAVDLVQADITARPMPIWTTSGWQTATTRENGLSNPGAICLQALRGVYGENGELLWGADYPDEMIDIEAWKAFMLHCTANNFTYDKWVMSEISIGDFLEEVCRAGMAERTFVDGGRPSVTFISPNQPRLGVVGMGNMAQGSFSVDYTLTNAADGIEARYIDRDRNHEEQTLRVPAPGVTNMLFPAQIQLEGVTTESHAAILARYHLAQSLYQFKTITYGALLERLDYRRHAILSVSHDMTQWGYSGHVLSFFKNEDETVSLELDFPVPGNAVAYIGLRVPGEVDYRVFEVESFEGESDSLKTIDKWPEGLPELGTESEVYDAIWCYDFKATPGNRVRVVDIQSSEDGLGTSTVTCVPESPEFWQYVATGVYIPPPVQPVKPSELPTATNLQVLEQTNIQGDTEWYELSATWDIAGDYDHSQLWAGLDGSELRMLDGNVLGTSATFRIGQKGTWLVRVIPFNARGLAGEAATVAYATTGVDLPPFNPGFFAVTLVEGSLRRYSWSYSGQKPASLAGVQIRYLPGDVALSVDGWDGMQPLGQPDDVYTGAFVTTRPGAGVWTFGLRAINTAGQLAPDAVRVVATLDTVFDNILQPDLTPPPAPSNLMVSAALTSALLQTEVPTYTQGHGHGSTRFYFRDIDEDGNIGDNPRLVAESPGNIGATSVALGERYYVTARWVSVDGVESAPSEPQALIVGKVGDSDLSDDLDIASKLADGSISGSKLADASVDSTKFASDIEPVTIVTTPTLPAEKLTTNIVWQGKLYTWDGNEYKTPEFGPLEFSDIEGQVIQDQIANNAISIEKLQAGAVTLEKFADGIEPVTVVTILPSQKLTETIFFNGKIYRWNGSTYTASVATTDLSGQVSSDQIANQAISLTKFASGIEPVAIVTGQLPTTKVTETISFNGKLYRWATGGGGYTAAIPTGDLSGQITSTQITDSAVTTAKLAANSVDADKLQANSVVAGKIAVGAVKADQIDAKAITVEKLAIANTDNLIANATFEGAVLYSNVIPPTGWSRISRTGSDSVVISSLVGSGWVNPPVDYVLYLNRATNNSNELSIVAHSINFGAPVADRTKNGILVRPGDEILLEWLNWQGKVNAGAWDAVGILVSNGNLNVSSFQFTAIQNATATGASVSSSVTGWATVKASLKYNGTEPARLYLRAQNTSAVAGDSVIMANMYARRRSAAELVVDGAIIASKLAVDSVTANAIAANSVTSTKIAANSVNADHVVAGAISTAKLAAGSVSTEKLAAGSVTATKLVIANRDSVFPDPQFRDLAWWNLVGKVTVWDGASLGAPVNKYAEFYAPNQGSAYGDYFPTEAGAYYRIRIRMFVTTNAAGTFTPMVHIPQYAWASPFPGISGEGALNVSMHVRNQWITYTSTWLAGGPGTQMQFRHDWNLTAGSVAFAWEIVRSSDADLIVDGAIVADKLAVNSVTTTKLASGSVTTLKLDALAVTAEKLAANSVSADKLQANSVVAGKIAAGAVKADQIDAKAITVEKLAVTYTDNLISNSTFENDTLHQVGYVPTGWTRYVSSNPSTQRVFLHGIILAGVPTARGIRLDRQAASTSELSITPHTVDFNQGVGTAGGANASGGVLAQPGDEFLLEWWAWQNKANAASWDAVGVDVASGNIVTGNLVFTAVLNSSAAGNSTYTTQIGTMVKYQSALKYTGSVPIRLYLRLNMTSGEAGAELSVYAPYFRRRGAASLIVDGAITANKLAANSIVVGTAAIQNGAIVNAMIGSLSADKITAGTLDANRIGANSIAAVHLASNSVTAVKLDAGAVTTDKLSANAVTAVKLAANSVNASKIEAGAITADKLSIGRSSNLCPDATFTPGLAFWGKYNTHDLSTTYVTGVNLSGWACIGSPTMYTAQSSNWYMGGDIGTYNKQVYSAPVSCSPGERYEASVYAGAHRCAIQVILAFYTAGGAQTNIVISNPGVAPAAGGTSLSSFVRLGGFATAPANSAYMRLILITGMTVTGQDSSYSFWTRPFIGLASATQSELSPWTPASNTQILPDGITTPSISALAGTFGNVYIDGTRDGALRILDNGFETITLGRLD